MKKNILLLSIVFFIQFMGTPIWGGNQLPNIMMTGYWNPTGQMIASFCTDTFLNPSGWIGENWEDMGYNVYSFFPEPGTYTGMFEVDYQNTWEDFWKITDSLHPTAIISYGVGPTGMDYDWELEYNAQNLKDEWVNDAKQPFKPTPSPPDSTRPVGYKRHPTLPIQEIEDAVNSETALQAWIDWDGNANRFLCEYLAYLGMWYQELHSSSDDPYPCQGAGYIHVAQNTSLTLAEKAASITLREVIKNLITTHKNTTLQNNASSLCLNIDQNPYQAYITLSFNLPERQNIKLSIYSLKGKLITSLIQGYGKSGENKIEFNSRSITSGIFICRLETVNYGSISKKVIVSK